MSDKPDWKVFEDDVEATYRLLGYETEQDVNIGNQQCDLIATTTAPGNMPVRLLVEIKSGAKSPTNADIFDLKSVFVSLRDHEHFTQAVLVSRTQPTQYAKGAAKQQGIKLCTLDQLRQEILDLRPYLRKFIYQTDSEGYLRRYVPLHFHLTSSHSAISDVKNGNILMNYTYDWLAKNDSLLTILGDYGSGKTTFLRVLMYKLSQDNLEGVSPTLFPLLIYLRDYNQIDFDARNVLLGHLAKDCGISGAATKLELYLKTGRVVVLFDGFDELSQRSNPELRRRHFEEIIRLARRNINIVLTSRPGYFVSQEELSGLLQRSATIIDELDPTDSTSRARTYRKRRSLIRSLQDALSEVDGGSRYSTSLAQGATNPINIDSFSDSEIDKYLELCEDIIRAGGMKTWEELRKKIDSTFDLRDLASRPILLDMIVQTVPKKSGEKRFNVAILYSAYTGFWLDRDYARGKRLITPPARRRFMEELSFQMFSERKFKIHYTNLSTRIKKAFRIESDLEQQYLATDIRTCTFLHRDARGYFSFIHPSFMDFFLASYYYTHLLSAKWKVLESVRLTRETVLFLGHLLEEHPRESDKMNSILNRLSGRKLMTNESNLTSNVIMLLSRVSSIIKKKKFVALDSNDLLIENIDLYNFSFTRSTLTNVSVLSANCDYLRLVYSNFERSEIRTSSLKHAQVKGGDFVSVDFSSTTFESSCFEGTEFSGGTIKDCTFNGIVFRGVVFQGVRFEGVRFENCWFIGGVFSQCQGKPRMNNCTSSLLAMYRTDHVGSSMEIVGGNPSNVAPMLIEVLGMAKQKLGEIDRSINDVLDDLRTELEHKRKERSEISRTLKTDRQKKKPLSSTLRQKKNSIEALETQIQDINDKIAGLTREKATLDSRLHQTLIKIEQHEKALSNWKNISRQERRLRKSQLGDLKKKERSIAKNSDIVADKISSVNEKKDAVLERLEAEKDRRRQIEFENRDLERSLRRETRKMENASRSIDVLEKEIERPRSERVLEWLQKEREKFTIGDLLHAIALIPSPTIEEMHRIFLEHDLTFACHIIIAQSWDKIMKVGNTISMESVVAELACAA